MESAVMEKNKSTYKLKGIGPIYYINLDDQPERKQYMEDMFAYWEVDNYERVSAYDGRNDDLSDIIHGRYPENMSSGEIGCTTSHLKLLKHYLETSDSPYCVVMEDDVDINVAKFWNFTWGQFIARLPYDYDVTQLAIICPGTLHVNLHRRFVNDFSTACYIITRHHAEKVVKFHCRGDKYKLDYAIKPRAVADDLIYNSGNTFAIPLFLYKIELGSSIHTEHVDTFHKNTYESLWNFWKVDATNVEDWNRVFEYDPYYGTLPPGYEGK